MYIFIRILSLTIIMCPLLKHDVIEEIPIDIRNKMIDDIKGKFDSEVESIDIIHMSEIGQSMFDRGYDHWIVKVECYNYSTSIDNRIRKVFDDIDDFEYWWFFQYNEDNKNYILINFREIIDEQIQEQRYSKYRDYDRYY